jgi:predicted dehydrogenase
LRHLPALARLGTARVVALADVDGARVDGLARRHGVDRRHQSHRELIEDDRVEAVVVCVPASLHADIAVAALEAGKHLLIEKPLALTLDDAERVREAAARSSGVVMLGFNMRWHRLLRRARAFVEEGGLGELQAIRTVFTSSFDYRDVAQPWRFRRETGGGALSEMGPHHLDLWRYLTRREVEEVFASSRSGDDDDETVVVTGVLDGGVRAETLLSQRSTNVNEIELFGERGRLRVSCYRYDGFELQLGSGFGGDVRQRLGGLARTAVELPAYLRGIRRGGDYVDSYTAEWRYFVEAASGRVPADPGLEDGVRNVEVLVAALESLTSSRAVPLGRAVAEVGS